MKSKLTPIFTGLLLAGVVNMPALADTNVGSADQNEQQLISNLTQKTAQLEQQVEQLQTELKGIKTSGTKTRKAKMSAKNAQYSASDQVVNKVPVGATAQDVNTGQVLLKQPIASGSTGKPVPVDLLLNNSNEALILGGTPVVTSPYLGVRSKFNASDLIVNIPVVNEDLRLMTQVQKARDVYCQYGLTPPDHPVVDISGETQITAFEQQPYTGTNNSDINLTDAEMDIDAILNPWVLAFMTFNYDNTPPAIGPRVTNSRVYMDRGFVTIGNLNRFPIYASMGQLYVPFGAYSTSMISTPLTQILGRIRARAFVLGFDQSGTYNGLNASIYAFKGDSSTSQDNSPPAQINNYGANIDYTVNEAAWSGGLGVSYVANITDSQGMQETGGDSSGFNGFGGNNPAVNTEVLVHKVPAYDLHGNLGVGDFSLVAEYLSTVGGFNAQDLTLNGNGARPAAFNSELGYNFKMFAHPSAFVVGYGQSWDALALQLPQRRYVAVLNTSFWRDTVEGLEFRHDINYGSNDTATGQQVAVATSGLGHTSNTLSAQISAFF